MAGKPGTVSAPIPIVKPAHNNNKPRFHSGSPPHRRTPSEKGLDDAKMDEVFKACVDAVRAPFEASSGAPAPIRPTVDDKLTLYGLFKQATQGDNSRPAPWVWQLTEHAKWRAWHERRGMSRAQAKTEYVLAVHKLLPPDGAPIDNRAAALAIQTLRKRIEDAL